MHTTTKYITLYRSTEYMTGKGEEWLIDGNDNVIAVYINAILVCRIFQLRNARNKKLQGVK